jgi:hypothetical protein
MEMHHLGDQSAADDANAQSRLSQAGRDYTPPIDDRSIVQAPRRPADLTASIVVAGAPLGEAGRDLLGSDRQVVGSDTTLISKE